MDARLISLFFAVGLTSTMDQLPEEDFAVAAKNRLYECLDRIDLPNPQQIRHAVLIILPESGALLQRKKRTKKRLQDQKTGLYSFDLLPNKGLALATVSHLRQSRRLVNCEPLKAD